MFVQEFKTMGANLILKSHIHNLILLIGFEACFSPEAALAIRHLEPGRPLKREGEVKEEELRGAGRHLTN